MGVIRHIKSGNTVYDIESSALTSPASIDGIGFNGSDNVTRYAACVTAAGTAAKTATLGADFALDSGATVYIKFTNANTAANPTLNVNGTGAKAIVQNGNTAAGSGSWAAGETVAFVYDGSNWNIINGAIASTSNYGPVKLDATPTNGSQNSVTSDGVYDALALKAPLASPALTGNPTAPTQSAGDNSTKIATTGYADAADSIIKDIALTSFPTETDSGTIASTEIGADGIPVKSLVAQIVPVQAGSGDPSPSNVRAISGWSKVDISHKGINLWDEEYRTDGYYDNSGNWTAASTLSSKNPILVRPGLTIRFVYAGTISDAVFAVTFWGADMTFISRQSGVLNTAVTIPDGCYYIHFNANTPYGTTYNNDISINYPATDTSYHPHAGGTESISLGQTVYGGSLNVTTGLLTVTHGYKLLTGDDVSAVASAGGVNYARFDNALSPDGVASDLSTVCNMYTPSAAATNKTIRINSATQVRIYDNDNCATEAGAKAFFSANNVQVVYKLATPITVQLTPVEVASVLGENNVFADSGDVAVTFRCDPDLFAATEKARTNAALATKADKDGTYPDLTAGFAQHLISSVGFSNSAPYLFRAIPAGAGNMEQLRGITGATVCWNQLVQNGDFSDGTTGWSTINCSASVSNKKCTLTVAANTNFGFYTSVSNKVEGHKVLFVCDAKIDSGNFTVNVNWGNKLTELNLTSASTRFSKICVVPSGNQNLNFTALTTDAIVLELSNIQIIDLTFHYGNPAIADRAYTLEQGTPGAGIAWLRSYGFFPAGVSHAYDAGSLQSVKVSAHKTTGNNLVNITNVTAAHTYDVSGLRITFPCYMSLHKSDDFAASSNVWEAVATLRDGTTAYAFPTAVSGTGIVNASASNPLVSIEVRYTNITAGSFDVQLVAGSTAKPYEPYVEHTYPLDSTVEWRGIYKLDAQNNIVADGDLYPPSGSATRRYGIVDLGTLEWTYVIGWWQTTISGIKYVGANTEVGKAIAQNFTIRVASGMTTAVAGELAIDTSNVKAVTGSNSVTPTGYLVYELDTPTSETASTYQLNQSIEAGGTEEFIDAAVAAGTRDVAVSPGTVSFFPLDAAQVLDAPSTDGTYNLRVTVSGGVPTYSWVSV